MVFKKFQWSETGQHNGNAQKCGEALEAIEAKNGEITPRLVVDAARESESPLHPCFEWDNSVAAEKFREDQARGVIRSIRVVFTAQEGIQAEPRRVYVNLQDEATGDRSYVPMARVLSEPELFERARAQFLREAKEFRARYREFDRLSALVLHMEHEAETLVPAEMSAAS